MMTGARSLIACAGIMGLVGVAIAAAGTHSGGGDLARTAAEFLMIHAGVVLCLGMALRLGIDRPKAWIVAGSALALGTGLFSADLALIAFWNLRPLPLMAPVGGGLMMAGWLSIVVGAAFKPLGDRRF